MPYIDTRLPCYTLHITETLSLFTLTNDHKKMPLKKL